MVLKFNPNQQTFNIRVIKKFMNESQRKEFVKKYHGSKHTHHSQDFSPEEIEMFRAKKYTLEQWQRFWKFNARESVARRLGQLYLNSCGLPYKIGTQRKRSIKRPAPVSVSDIPF